MRYFAIAKVDLINLIIFLVEFTEVPADIVIAEGDAAEFICLFTSTNPASVTWQKDGVAVIPSSRITITSSSITIDPTVEGDNGTYSCIVNDQVDLTTETRSAELEFACKIRLYSAWS